MASITRRIQVTGGSTYIISLPSRWVKVNNFTKGSELSLDEINNNLIISGANAKRQETVKKVNLSEKVDRAALQRALTSFYIANFDTLVVKTSGHMTQEIREEIKNFARLVMGVEIFEESSNSIVLQNVLDSASFPLSKAVRRMSMNVSTMIKDVITGMSENDIDLLDTVSQRDDDVDRYQWYVYREVRRKSTEDSNNIFYLILSRILERIADHSVNLCRIWKNKPKSDISADILISNLEKSLEMYEQATDAFYSNDYAILNSIIEQKGDVINRKVDLTEKSRAKEGLSTIASASEEILRIGLYSTDIAELTMDKILASREEMNI